MGFGELFQSYLAKVREARVYLDQGLVDYGAEVLGEIQDDLRTAELSDDEKSDLRSRIESCLRDVDSGHDTLSHNVPEMEAAEEHPPAGADTLQSFQYGLALMDGQFWEEAIDELQRAAVLGEHTLKCWELCGDCAGRLERWDKAVRYYEMVYTDPGATDELKRHILLKITKCSQIQRKTTAKSTLFAKSDPAQAKQSAEAEQILKERNVEALVPSVASLDQSSIIQLLGNRIHSWQDDAARVAGKETTSYRVNNLLHVGITSLVVELEVEGTGERLAGQSLTAPYNSFLTPQALAKWVHSHMMVDSSHAIKVRDLAHAEDLLFIVREYLPFSLSELLSRPRALPLPLAVSIAYHVLEGLGDLHLRMGKDERIRSIFHLDLRPSRILLHNERPVVKISNGGLWKLVEASNPEGTSLKHLPLPLLGYRAPEQFRPYLARKKPPVFTDIYLFGVLFYEMLTGMPAFHGLSYEEYEIQHCEQYPTPPKVWRSEIPEELNDMVMKCLERDPFKRWRSTTQMSLVLEKSYNHLIHALRRGALQEFLAR
jgi:serine/threonine protein kinase